MTRQEVDHRRAQIGLDVAIGSDRGDVMGRLRRLTDLYHRRFDITDIGIAPRLAPGVAALFLKDPHQLAEMVESVEPGLRLRRAMHRGESDNHPRRPPLGVARYTDLTPERDIGEV